MNDNYVLNGHTPVLEPDLSKWGQWFETADRVVKVTKTTNSDVSVSTVFLGINHNWNGGPPHLFETMIFGGDHDMDCERCSTWDQALVQHDSMCDRLKMDDNS